MWIEIADKSGFCFGVERAIRLTEEAAERFGEVWTSGPLIHNPIVTKSLEKKGVHIADNVESAAGKPLVIRSHGVSAQTGIKAAELCAEVIDATCPFVAKIHKIVSETSAEAVVVLGDRTHPEVIGIMGHAVGRVYACAGADDIEGLFTRGELSDNEDVALVVQTTFDRGRFEEYSERIARNHSRVKIYDTICHATSERQRNAEELAKRAALMIVVGGRSSSNTGALAAICARHCRTVFAESAADIPRQILSGLRSDSLIGITAGASTPVYTIKEVHERMNEEIRSVNENEEDFAALLEADQSFIKLRNGMRVKATVVSVSDREVCVEVGAKQTGYIACEELTNNPEAVAAVVKVGDVIDAIVIKVDDSTGTAALSKKRVDTALSLEKMMAVKDANETIEGVVSNVVKGGVIVFSDNTRIFIPASQTGIPRNGSLDVLLKQTVKLKIIEVNDQRGGRVVGSIKLANKEVRDAERAKFWENIEVGQKFVGEVRSIEDYGVFVDIGAVDGLVRTSELTWNRVGHPKDIVKIGDKINVIVKSYDPEKKRVSLSAKDPDDNPWTKFIDEYSKGDVIKATIVSITEFGAFAQIIPGVDGLIHISQISTERVNNIASVLSVGQEVEVKIIEIDTEKNRVSLSIKALMEETASDDSDDEE